MKPNNRRDLKKKEFTTEEFDRRETKVKSLKSERKERHKAKNQKVHQYARHLFLEDEDL